jgi:hypothetical protein
MKTKIEAQSLWIGEEDKSGWCTGIEAERVESEKECAVHIQGFDLGPIVSLYLSPVDAAMLGVSLIQSAREAEEEE